jgi:hypothetical protein
MEEGSGGRGIKTAGRTEQQENETETHGVVQEWCHKVKNIAG